MYPTLQGQPGTPGLPGTSGIVGPPSYPTPTPPPPSFGYPVGPGNIVLYINRFSKIILM